MAQIILGNRIGRLGTLAIGCCAAIFDPTRQKILLTRRTDNGQWCLPGGHMESGESTMEACIREVREETGLDVEVTRLIGVYSNPHRLVEYADGNRYTTVALAFEAVPIGGELGLSDETTAYGYFSQAEIAAIELMHSHPERIDDAFAGETATFMR